MAGCGTATSGRPVSNSLTTPVSHSEAAARRRPPRRRAPHVWGLRTAKVQDAITARTADLIAMDLGEDPR